MISIGFNNAEFYPQTAVDFLVEEVEAAEEEAAEAVAAEEEVEEEVAEEAAVDSDQQGQVQVQALVQVVEEEEENQVTVVQNFVLTLFLSWMVTTTTMKT